jgi:hypothetical protein
MRKSPEDENSSFRKYKVVNDLTTMFSKTPHIEEALLNVCEIIHKAFFTDFYVQIKIIIDNQAFNSADFKISAHIVKYTFDLPDNKHGDLEIHYGKKNEVINDSAFFKTIGTLISGYVSKIQYSKLLHNYTERLKELEGIKLTSEVLISGKSLVESLQEICSILPQAWQYPEYTAARITYNNNVFTSRNFTETPWVQKQTFTTSDNKQGVIEIFYLKEFPYEYEGPFLKEERNLLINLANIFTSSASKDVFEKLLAENRERVKELSAINQTTHIINKGMPTDETLQRICNILPKSWQYPDYTAARIRYEGQVYSSRKFKNTPWFQKESFVTIDNKKGSIEIYYLKEFPKEYDGPFLKEECSLLLNIAKLISGYLNHFKGREIIYKAPEPNTSSHKSEEYRNSLIKNKQPLQLFFNKQVLDKYIYLDMMKYKVKDILFVANLYDAFILENEDSFFEQFMGEIYQYSLFSLPRITGVTSSSEALELMDTTHFDLVILMVGMDSETPLELSRQIKEKNEKLTVYLLLNQKSNFKYFEELIPTIKTVDKLFVWNGNSQILFAIVKSIEDNANVENDTKMGLVRVILLVEDSAQYYSKYLQFLYSIVFGQIQQILPEVEKNELNKISKMRSRPKILHATNYDDAIYIFNKYKDYMLCVISDMEFEQQGKLDKNAGVRFIKYIQSQILGLPIILQSSDKQNEKIAARLGVQFLNKNSESLLTDLKNFLTFYLGFGNFIFRNKEGNKVAVARSLREFEEILHTIPEESLYFHGIDNQFSLWLMARGEIQLAKVLNPIQITNFDSLEGFRQHFINAIKIYREEKKKGKILTFDETSVLDEKNIVSFSGGSLGGKGRGLAFINTLIYNLDFSAITSYINIRTPITVIIGTDEFEYFMEKNHLYDRIFAEDITFDEIKRRFMAAHLSSHLIKKLEVFVEQVNKPIAVRSSSISEDSLNQPFAGVFDTFIVTNNLADKKQTVTILGNAIKMVYASVYSDNARTYFKAVQHKVEEERMAVVLQELVGSQHGDYYYPHISGTAQSYNYYPIANMKPEEGFAVAAVGLGYYVVGGSKSYRFSPKYPNIDIYTTKDLINSTQVNFFAVDMTKENVDYSADGELASLALLDISVAEKHGTLKHCASVYNPDNDRVEAGLDTYGPRIINFSNILKYNYIPFAQTIDIMLETIKEAFGSPVEIEYAVDLNKTQNNLPSFYLLQIKPLININLPSDVEIDKPDKNRTILYTESSLGNGEIKDIKDIIYIDTEKFNKLETLDMVKEIEVLNQIMLKEKRKYILIGPGRWGTRDQYLGLPVVWSQISNAKLIVEISLQNFPLDSSLGSHFFHNVTSMNIGYLSVLDTSSTDFIKWNILDKQKILHHTKYFKHIQFKNPLTILMNGKRRISNILYNP